MRKRKHRCIFNEDIYLALKEIGIYYEFYLASKISGEIVRKVNMFKLPYSLDDDDHYTFSYRQDGGVKLIRVDMEGETNNIKYNILIGWGR